jgi:serine O-acetyltransferase
MQLVNDVQDLLSRSPKVAKVLNLKPFDDFASLAGALLASVTGNPAIGDTAADIYGDDRTLVELTCHDIAETARRNFEPGGPSAVLLFSRGVQAVMAHRVAHKLWTDGDTTLALAVKSTCGRAFDTDIHPAATLGTGLWLDHGLGFVVGETSVIEDNVSIWHNVTLGSTLNDSGSSRHPHIKQGAVIGAGALLLGGITIGVGANIGAGAIVVENVADHSLVVGPKSQARGTARISFAHQDADT